MEIRKSLRVLAKNLKNNIPFYVLYGLNHNPKALYTIRSIEDSFLPFKRQSIFDQLWKVCEDILPEHSENIMGMLHEGWEHFNGKDIYSSYFKKDDKKLQKLLTLYPINAIKMLRRLFEGIEHRDWYAETYDAFVELLPEYDIKILVKTFAITSPLQHPSSNLLLAIEAHDCLLDPQKSILQMNCFDSIKNILFELETDTFNDNLEKTTRRKILNFLNGLNGDEQAVTIDAWILIATGRGKVYLWTSKGKYYLKCRKCEYDILEHYIKSLAEVSGFQPRQITAMVWAGARKLDGKYKDANMRKIILRLPIKSPD